MSIQVGVMKKAEAMDKLLEACSGKISSLEIISIVDQVFKINLESLPDVQISARETIDSYLDSSEDNVTGAHIRKMINQTFNVNLDALSALDGAKISLYSKNQWVIHNEKDLFVVHTGTGDVDVRIVPTAYFAEQTGSDMLPIDLINALVSLGYYYDEDIKAYYYLSPTGEAVADSFKGQTMMAIRKVIVESYSHL